MYMMFLQNLSKEERRVHPALLEKPRSNNSSSRNVLSEMSRLNLLITNCGP